MIDRLKIFVSLLVIGGFCVTFGRGFQLTWTHGHEIADQQRAAAEVERDRKDASRRLDDAKAALAKANDSNREALTRDVEVRQANLEALNQKATTAAEAVAKLMQIFSDNFNYLATVLAGLVGTVVATMFGQELQKQKAAAASGSPAAQTAKAAGSLVVNVGHWREKLSSLYAVVYLLFGAVAIGTWVLMPFTPEMIKNLATISLTLMLAIARSFFD